MSQQQRDVIEQKGPNQIVRIRSDSETNLDDLFKAVTHPKDSQVALGVPMRLRNLPPSFFQQPERSGSKSASHSRESSADGTFPSAPSPQPHPSGLPINHPRAHSSPASLQQTYNSNTSQHQHLRQQSYDITDDVPLPPGWAMAKTPTGQRYFLNHVTQTTTWEDPRKKQIRPTTSGSQQTPSDCVVLPSGHPSPLNLGPLPDGWEQSTTREGEVYFINHIERTTSWFDPRIPIHLQRPPVMQNDSNNQSSANQQQPPPSFSTSQMSLQQRQQKARLQRLQMERERLKLRQQEILRQTACIGNPMLNEVMLRQSLGEEIPTSPTSTDLVSTTGIDPFLGGTDFHSRQESADSGLGLGPNYSLPHTPEDFLSNMEDSVDASIDDSSQQNGDLGLDSLQNSNMDLGTENMDDSDDLVPSLQEELNADILPDIEALLNSNKDNVLTWL